MITKTTGPLYPPQDGESSTANDNSPKKTTARKRLTHLHKQEFPLDLADTIIEQYRQLLEGMPVAVYTTNAQGVINLYNQEAVKLWGREPIIGKDMWCGSWKIYNIDGSPMALSRCPMALTLQEGRAVTGHEIIIERPDGTRRNVLPSPKPIFNPNGVLIGAINTLIDITEWKRTEDEIRKSEANLRAIFDNSKDAYMLIDSNERIVALNQVCNHLYRNIHGKDIVPGVSIYDVIPAENVEVMKSHVWKAFSGEAVQNRTKRTGKNGKDVWLRGIYNPVKSESGTIIGVCISVSNITDEVVSQSVIRESEANLRALFDNAKDGFVLIDLNANILAFNHAAADLYSKVTGKKLSINKSVPEVLGVELGAYLVAVLEKVKSGESIERKSKQHGLDGKDYWLRGFYNPVRSSDGSIIGICMGVSDISAEMEANSFSLQLAAIVQSSEDAIVGKTFEGIVTSWNPGAQRIFGYTPEEMIGQSITKLIPQDRLDEEPKILERLKKGERVEHFETIRITKSGERRNISLIISPIRNAGGNLVGASKVARDITEQKILQEKLRIAEANFRDELERVVRTRTIELKEKNDELTQQKDFIETVLDSSIDQICVYDKDSRFIGVNKAFSQSSKIKAHEILGKSFLEVFPSYKNSDIHKTLEKTLATNEPVTIQSTSLTGHHYAIYSVPLTQNNINQGAIVIAHDNTTIIEANEKLESISEKLRAANDLLEEKNSDLERSNSELERFAYVASHDLQEPLRKIQMFAGRIRSHNKERMDETSQNYFNKIDASSERMSSLIKDILNYSRLKASEQEFGPTDLNEIIDHALTDYDLFIEEKKAKIEIDKLPIIAGVPAQLDQLFHNLIGNALKFSKDDTIPIISITAHKLTIKRILEKELDTSNTYYEIIIKDSGIGFDQEFSEKIFVIFQRLNERTKYEGTGIGLALCRKIVDNHCGLIFAESKEGEGSEFHIILPEKQKN